MLDLDQHMNQWSKPEDYIEVLDDREYITLILKQPSGAARVIHLKPQDADYIVRQLKLLLQKRSLETQ